MKVGDVCQRNVVTARPFEGIAEAAETMRSRHVGYLVVVDMAPERDVLPVGVLTDRDIVVAVVAKGVDARTLTIGDVMTRKPMLLSESESIDTALQRLRAIGVRRAPVVGARGELAGILSLDDVLDAVADQLSSIAGSIRNEQRIERALRR